MTLTEKLTAFGKARGADDFGVVSAEAYEAKVPNLQKPSTTAAGMKSIIAFTKHMVTGSYATRDIPIQSLNSHYAIDACERLSFEISEWLEARGYLGVPVPPEAADMDLQRAPAGTLDLKWVCEEANIGQVGLDLNFLSPDYGARVYLGAVMTDAPLNPTPPRDEELCPGMKCGRCAVICPTQAIPLTAPRGAHLNAYRNLNKRNCASGAERLGIKPLYLNLERLVSASPRPNVDAVVDHRYWKEFWQSINNKLGAFAACFECFYVCPVGEKDFRKIIALKYRKLDIPPGRIKRQFTDDRVTMIWLGVPEERKPEYERDKDFADLILA